MNQPEIYIHVGMSRTASTFLQYQVFKHFKGIFYERKIKFKNSYNLLVKTKREKYLISDELDNRDVEQILTRFSEQFPLAKPIVILRRQDEWIVSQYKRHLKNGDHRSFEEFFDLKDDSGFIKKKHLQFHDLIEFLDNHFSNESLIILFDDLRKDPQKIILRMAEYMGTEINFADVNFTPRHVSYSDRQIRAIFRASGIINLSRSKRFKKKWKNRLSMFFPEIIRYAVLYGSPVLPELSKGKDPVLPQKELLEEIRDYFSDDWKKCLRRAGSI